MFFGGGTSPRQIWFFSVPWKKHFFWKSSLVNKFSAQIWDKKGNINFCHYTPPFLLKIDMPTKMISHSFLEKYRFFRKNRQVKNIQFQIKEVIIIFLLICSLSLKNNSHPKMFSVFFFFLNENTAFSETIAQWKKVQHLICDKESHIISVNSTPPFPQK